MSTQVERGEFHLIVAEVDPSKLDEAAHNFAQAFTLDPQIAQQIVKSAPIIFASNLTKKEVKAISDTLQQVSAHGIEFRITARVAKKMPKVNWPVRPQFTAGGIQGVNGLAFQWENNAFVCPSCGETFLFRHLGRLPLVEGAETEGNSNPGPAPAAVPAKAAAPARVPAKAPQPQRVQVSAPAEPDLAPIELASEAEQIDLPDQVEQISLSESDLASPGSDVGEINIDAGLELDAGGPPPPPGLEEAAAEGGEFSAAVEEAAAQEEEAIAAGGDLYNVFLSKIADVPKRQKAAELIQKIKACPADEARELASRLVIPLAKNVRREKAEDILNQFKKLKIFGRMTKAK